MTVRQERSGHQFLASLLFGLALFGYPLVANVVSYTGVDSRLLSVPFRLLVALGSIALILVSPPFKSAPGRLVLLMVWLAYIIRLIHDLLFTDLEGADYALQFFVAGCVLPAVAIWKSRSYKQNRFAGIALTLCGMGTSLTILGSLLGRFGERDLTQLSGRLSTEALNPITIGHLGVSGLIALMALWPNMRGLPRRLLLVLVSVPLLIAVVQAGSKGPALAFVICVSLWLLRSGRYISILTFVSVAYFYFILFPENPIANRLNAVDEDMSTLERLKLFADSIDQIQSAPLFGSAFVELNSRYYPHNVFLEAALAMGLPMAMVLSTLLIWGLLKSWRVLRYEEVFVPLLYIQGFIAALTSGSMFGAVMVWIPLMIILKPGINWKHMRRGTVV